MGYAIPRNRPGIRIQTAHNRHADKARPPPSDFTTVVAWDRHEHFGRFPAPAFARSAAAALDTMSSGLSPWPLRRKKKKKEKGGEGQGKKRGGGEKRIQANSAGADPAQPAHPTPTAGGLRTSRFMAKKRPPFFQGGRKVLHKTAPGRNRKPAGFPPKNHSGKKGIRNPGLSPRPNSGDV